MKSTDADEFKSMKVPYDHFKAAREDILRRGLDTIPEDLIPPECRHLKTVTIGMVAGIALRALALLNQKGSNQEMTTNSCPACAYKDGVPRAAFLALAVWGETDNAVADGVAIGIGTGLAMVKLTPRQQRRVLGGFCAAHKRCIKLASEAFKL